MTDPQTEMARRIADLRYLADSPCADEPELRNGLRQAADALEAQAAEIATLREHATLRAKLAEAERREDVTP